MTDDFDDSEWYEDSDGDSMPASPDAWAAMFDDPVASAEYWASGLIEEEP